MGENDTKPVESVQAAVSLFEEKSGRRICQSIGRDELEKEKEVEYLLKRLANYKVQLEVKESAYMQTLQTLDIYEKRVDELSAELKSSEDEKAKDVVECREGSARILELESKMKEISDQLLETMKNQEQLSHVLGELKGTQGELLSMETELAAARESKLEAVTRAELMEEALNIEKKKIEELLSHVSELNEAIRQSSLAAIEAEKEKCALLSEREAEIEMVTARADEALEQLEYMRKEIGLKQKLENQLLTCSISIDSLQLELKQATELHESSANDASDVLSELKQLKEELEMKERKNLDQVVYIQALENEVNLLRLELKTRNEKVCSLNFDVELLRGELQKANDSTDEILGRDSEAQVEIALLKSELHKSRSKIAAAEAAEARAESVKTGLYLAVQQLASEVEEAKKESQRLKQRMRNAADEYENENSNSLLVETQLENSSRDGNLQQTDKLDKEEEEGRDNIEAHITISVKEFESLLRKAEKADKISESEPEAPAKLNALENRQEVEVLKKELEVAMVKIGEFRSRAEQAASRAELAEKAKAELEDRLRNWREKKQKRQAAFAALQEAYAHPPKSEITPSTYEPLGKVLNLKF